MNTITKRIGRYAPVHPSALIERFTPVVANALLIFLILAFYGSEHMLLVSFISERTLHILGTLALGYVTGYALYAVFFQTRVSKGQLFFVMLGKLIRGRQRTITGEEKVAGLAILVKAYFIPIMVQFLIQNSFDVFGSVHTITDVPLSMIFSMQGFSAFLYPFLFTLLLFVDVSYFVYGYIVDHPMVGSPIKSVEPTFTGWFVTIICYPPFNTFTVAIIGWYAADNAYTYELPWLIFVMNIVALILFTIYVWATIALGSKCSNLTNRGIVSRGPYAVVRHPAYAAKNAVWILSVIPLFNAVAFASVILWATIYYLRAMTEERHLSRDPDYLAYQKAVPYRFIPRLW